MATDEEAAPVLDSSDVGAPLALVDAEGTLVGWTQAAQQLLGYPAGEAVNRSAGIMVASAEDSVRAVSFAAQCRTRTGWSGTVEVRHRDGYRFDAGLRVFPLRGLGGARHWLISVHDLDTASSSATKVLRPSSLLTRAPIGIVIRDLDLRCAWVNEAAEQRDGIPPDARLGQQLATTVPGFESKAMESVTRQVLASGTPAVDLEYPAWLPEKARAERTFSVSFFRLDGADGRAPGVCALMVDAVDKARARERLATLNESSTRIGTSLDIMRTGQELADHAVSFLADFVTVDLGDSLPSVEEKLAPLGPTGNTVPGFLRVGLASINPGVPESLSAQGEAVFTPEESPFLRVVSSGKPYLEPVCDPFVATWLHADRARAEKFIEHGMHSLMVVPIHARGTVLGVVVFIRTLNPMPFDEGDLLLAEKLVSRASLPLDHAVRYTHERTVALALQRNLLPGSVGGGAAVEVASRYLPADTRDGIGGDWFDVISLSGARVALVVGDVVGHGINAAATMGTLRTAIHTLADMDLPPDELLARLDDLVIRLAEKACNQDAKAEAIGAAALGATCLYAIYDPVTGMCSMATAGHPPPAVIDPQGRASFPDLPTSPPLGLGMTPFEAADVELPEATVLAFYTDGLVESRDQDIDVGMDRLRTVLAPSDRPLEELCSAVIDALPAKITSDDVALLLARTRVLSPNRVASWELRADPAVVGSARSLAARQLEEWELQDLMPATELIVSELVTNAIRHGTGSIRLRLIRHQVLTCEVSDASNSFPRLRHARTTDENGRGLFLVAQMCHRWGARYTADGKSVWAEQELP